MVRMFNVEKKRQVFGGIAVWMFVRNYGSSGMFVQY